MTYDERYALCGGGVTLNGQPATVTGAQHAFAMVRDVRSGLGCEWAWETVARIRANGGAFKS
jgi:hypothetical protein